MDVEESDKDYRVTAELPGMEERDVPQWCPDGHGPEVRAGGSAHEAHSHQCRERVALRRAISGSAGSSPADPGIVVPAEHGWSNRASINRTADEGLRRHSDAQDSFTECLSADCAVVRERLAPGACPRRWGAQSLTRPANCSTNSARMTTSASGSMVIRLSRWLSSRQSASTWTACFSASALRARDHSSAAVSMLAPRAKRNQEK